jgi:excisionase family DNA binding protein
MKSKPLVFKVSLKNFISFSFSRLQWLSLAKTGVKFGAISYAENIEVWRGFMVERLAISIKEAAEALGVNPYTVRNYIRDGKLIASKIGRRVLIEPSELRRLLDQGRPIEATSQKDAKGDSHAK